MGALRDGICYATNAEAADAHFLSMSPAITSGATSYVSWFEKGGNPGVWQIKRQSIASNGAITNLTTSTATQPLFPVCTEAQTFTDGLTIGWGIASLMVAAYGYSMVRKAAR